MKPTQEQVITWAREAGYHLGVAKHDGELLQRFAALAYEAGRKDENAACAKVCEDMEVLPVIYGAHPDYLEGKLMAISQAAAAIRARREQ